MQVFRVRTLKKEEIIDETNPLSFKYPPKDKLKMARANRKHHQVLCTSADYKTAFCECEKEINKHKSITYLSSWESRIYKILVQMRNFCLGINVKDDGSDTADFINYISTRIFEFLNSMPEKMRANLLYAQKVYTELFVNSKHVVVTAMIKYTILD